VIKPKSLLPFGVNQNQSLQAVRRWIDVLWFAPNDLKKYAETGKLKGLYIPFWTFDCGTSSNYRGERGEHYYETENYTTTQAGKQVTQSRQVRKTRWYPASGNVDVQFDDVLVLASNTLQPRFADRLEPWDLPGLVPYQEEYLSGFRTEIYHVDLPHAFSTAKQKMESPIHSAICRDIGGDEQRVHQKNTTYKDITFKHILLPVWIGGYRYGGKIFNILVNARTGEVQGDRPYSWIKITLFVLVLLAILILILMVVN
jgi:hypothetical protein